jgi:hypothetical protein
MAQPTPKITEPPKPILKAYSVAFKDSGWCLVTHELQGDKVVKSTYSQPNLLALILARAPVLLDETKEGRK